MKLINKIALITGAGQGIGKETALLFAKQGAQVIATDVNEQALKTFEGIANIKTCVLDITNQNQISSCINENPNINVLMNCAGVVFSGSALTCTDEQWQTTLAVNVTSAYQLIKAVLPGMLAQKSGAIINIASVVSSVKGVANRFAYGTSKAAIIGLTKAVAADFIAQGIRCNSISPGTIHSPSLDQRLSDTGDYKAALAAFIDRQPMGRLGQPSEIAAIASLLASDDASFMSGENIIIDGGMSL
ncbi:SDR family oxidoreductase [Candidatus Colwellia aromaticivorans]|uniref:SDR family oxidoreductase n=1 Tax=Candidatus Colwellia aromaticivorans TaxID=2267621 RepID=UPI000DF12752|nr:SDR family oxidoreductase [Candidatus Colwellia aromaticivorans]